MRKRAAMIRNPLCCGHRGGKGDNVFFPVYLTDASVEVLGDWPRDKALSDSIFCILDAIFVLACILSAVIPR